MVYKRTFVNGMLHIELKTNNSFFYRLIDNYLDFINKSTPLCNKNIVIKFHINKIPDKEIDKRYLTFYQIRRNFSSLVSKKTVDISVTDNSRIVKCDVYNYRGMSKELLLDNIFMQPLCHILRNRGYFFVHSATLIKDRNIIFVIGPKDSGKTTIALSLYKKEFNILADDKCYIKMRKGKIFLLPFPTKIGINDKYIARAPHIKKHILRDYRYGNKFRFSLRNICGFRNHLKHATCKIALFPKYKVGNMSIRTLPRKEALYRLLKENLMLYDKGRYSWQNYLDNFRTLNDFICKIDSFELTYNDNNLNKIEDIIKKLAI